MSKELKLTKTRNNAAIKINVLPEEEMRKIGFTDFRENYWYLGRVVYTSKLSKWSTISFNLSVCKTNPSDWRIDVLDDDFCQPYDYQYLIAKGSPTEVAIKVNERVEEIMAELAEKGIVEGHIKGEYI